VIDRLADAVERRSEEFARRVSSQNGMPVFMSVLKESRVPVATLRYYAKLARETAFEETRPGFLGGEALARGLHGGTQALAGDGAGRVPARGGSRGGRRAPGVLNIVPADREAGAYLVAHPGVDKVAFTGSTAAGRAVARQCGELLRPVTLELGGKSAAIILDDAELDLGKIGEGLFTATLFDNAQTCHLSTRVLAPRSRYAEVVDAFTALAGSLRVGDALGA
jgi:acyl-CoA reductase-like NAD-dependent aldehyde dehydrogenase